MAPKVYNASTSANTKTGRPSGVMSLATGTMSASETTNYRLRMYVDESYNPQGDGGGLSFSVKINAYGKVKEAPTGSKMKAYITQADLNKDKENFTPPQTDFHTDAYMSKITAIITKKDNIVPATATESWDISEAGDGSVMAYVEDDGTGNSTYKLTIGGKGGIIANESMIGYFNGFNKMTSIDLSVLDTSEVTNMGVMFAGCNKLTSLDVSNFDTSKVTNMSAMFSMCCSLTSLDLSSFDTSQVTDMSNMFSGFGDFPEGIEEINLSSFDTSKVTNMSGMFADCIGLTSLDLSNFDTSKVTDMSVMFDDCSSLTSLDVSNFDTSQVTNMQDMFDSCSSLTSLDVSNFDTSQVTDMSWMFGGCRSLTSLDVSNFDTSEVTNMSGMFSSCSSLTNLDLRSFDTSKVTDMRRMFFRCNKLTQITVSNKWVVVSSASTDEMFNNCGTDHVTVV